MRNAATAENASAQASRAAGESGRKHGDTEKLKLFFTSYPAYVKGNAFSTSA
jgi:hypothetical protein